MPAQMLGDIADLALARQKNQNIALLRRVLPKLIDAIGDGLVQTVVFALFKRAIALFDRKHATRNRDDGREDAFAIREMLGKAISINSG